MIEIKTAYQHRQRRVAPRCYVIHNTGSNNEAADISYYERNDHGIAPNFAIGREGKRYQVVPPNQLAYHVKMSNEQKTAYSTDWTPPSWWAKRWPGVRSPLDLKTGLEPNASAIGIEVVGSDGDFTEAQYAELAALLLDLSRSGPPLAKDTLLGHSDVNPLARSNDRGPTDPGVKFDWKRLYRSLGLDAGDDQNLGHHDPPITLAGNGAPAADLQHPESGETTEKIGV